MKRRTLLAATATAVAGLSGCLADDGGAGDGSGGDATGTGDGGSDGGSDGSDGTVGGDCSGGDDCGPPEVASSSINTTADSCGSQDADDASASLDGDTLTIEGVVSASTPCHEAVLGGAEVQDGELTIGVGLEATGGICSQCIAEIDYRATVEVTNVYGLDGVTVDHTDAGEHTFSMDEIAGGG